jgi:hypothetical protein
VMPEPTFTFGDCPLRLSTTRPMDLGPAFWARESGVVTYDARTAETAGALQLRVEAPGSSEPAPS